MEAIVAGHDPMSPVLLRLYRRPDNLLAAVLAHAPLPLASCTDSLTASCPPLAHPRS